MRGWTIWLRRSPTSSLWRINLGRRRNRNRSEVIGRIGWECRFGWQPQVRLVRNRGLPIRRLWSRVGNIDGVREVSLGSASILFVTRRWLIHPPPRKGGKFKRSQGSWCLAANQSRRRNQAGGDNDGGCRTEGHGEGFQSLTNPFVAWELQCSDGKRIGNTLRRQASDSTRIRVHTPLAGRTVSTRRNRLSSALRASSALCRACSTRRGMPSCRSCRSTATRLSRGSVRLCREQPANAAAERSRMPHGRHDPQNPPRRPDASVRSLSTWRVNWPGPSTTCVRLRCTNEKDG